MLIDGPLIFLKKSAANIRIKKVAYQEKERMRSFFKEGSYGYQYGSQISKVQDSDVWDKST